jgi:hypothetical protein
VATSERPVRLTRGEAQCHLIERAVLNEYGSLRSCFPQ